MRSKSQLAKVFGIGVLSLSVTACSAGFMGARPALGIGIVDDRGQVEDDAIQPFSSVAETEADGDVATPLSLLESLELSQFSVPEKTLSELTESQMVELSSKYNYLDPKHVVPAELLSKAVAYFDANASVIKNKTYMGVVDYSARSTQGRFFIINMQTGDVSAIHIAHGSGSDSSAHNGYAVRFGNGLGSNMSSLGFSRTDSGYVGKHGFSLHLDGLSSTNSNLRKRTVVVHDADYVHDASVVQGRSNGCIAVSHANHDGVMKRMAGGALIYAGLSK